MDELVTKEMVLAALRNVQDPELRNDLVSLNMIDDIEIKGDYRLQQNIISQHYRILDLED
jgi:metal-sulfur cluster biosynthetic enzyme